MNAKTGQASMEFIMILGAVAAFAVFALGIYLHMAHSQTGEYLALLNATAANNIYPAYTAASANALLEYIYAPSVVYVNQSSQVQVVAYSSNATIESISASAQGIKYSPSGYYNISLNQVQVFTFSVVPERTGELNMALSSEIRTQSGVSYANRSVSLYSVLQPAYSGTGSPINPPLFVPSINETRSAALSGLVQENNVSYISEWSHCGYIGFWGHELSMAAECGSNAEWYYYAFSSPCYYDYAVAWATTCIYENQTGSKIYSIGTQERYLYNVSLRLSNASAGTALYSMFNNSASKSALWASPGNLTAGNILVSNSITAYVPVQDYAYYVLGKSGNYTIINSSGTGRYLQLYNYLNNVLGYYNGSEINGGELATIQQTISSYNKGVSEVYNSTAASSPCGIADYQGGKWYSCRPFGAIEFGNITVEISNSLPHRSGSFTLAGSYIYVR